MHDSLSVNPTSIDHHVSNFTIERIALFEKLMKLAQWILNLEERAISIHSGSFPKDVWGDIQVDDKTAAGEVVSIFRPQYDATARRYDPVGHLCTVIDDL